MTRPRIRLRKRRGSAVKAAVRNLPRAPGTTVRRRPRAAIVAVATTSGEVADVIVIPARAPNRTHRPRRDGEHVDTVRLEFAVQSLGQALDVGLGGGVVGLSRDTLPAEDRPEQHDAARCRGRDPAARRCANRRRRR